MYLHLKFQVANAPYTAKLYPVWLIWVDYQTASLSYYDCIMQYLYTYIV